MSCKLKDRHTMAKRKKDKKTNNDLQENTHKTIEPHEPHKKQGMNSGALEG